MRTAHILARNPEIELEAPQAVVRKTPSKRPNVHPPLPTRTNLCTKPIWQAEEYRFRHAPLNIIEGTVAAIADGAFVKAAIVTSSLQVVREMLSTFEALKHERSARG